MTVQSLYQAAKLIQCCISFRFILLSSRRTAVYNKVSLGTAAQESERGRKLLNTLVWFIMDARLIVYERLAREGKYIGRKMKTVLSSSSSSFCCKEFRWGLRITAAALFVFILWQRLAASRMTRARGRQSHYRSSSSFHIRSNDDDTVYCSRTCRPLLRQRLALYNTTIQCALQFIVQCRLN